MSVHKLHCAEAALMISWQTDRLLIAFSEFFAGKYALSRLTDFSNFSTVTGWQSTFSKCGVQHQQRQPGKRKAQRSSSIVAEPAIGVENEDNDDEVTTSLCGIHGQTLLSPAAAALCNHYCVHVWCEHAQCACRHGLTSFGCI